MVFAVGTQAFVAIDQGWVPAEAGRERGGVEGASDAVSAAGDASLSAIMAAIAIEWGEACQAGDLGSVQATEFGHEDDEGEGGAPTDALDAFDERHALGEVGNGADSLAEQEQFGLHAPGQPVGFAGQGALEAWGSIRLGARAGAREVGLQLLDEPQMLGERFQLRVWGGAHLVQLSGAARDQGRIEPVALGQLQPEQRERANLPRLQHRNLEPRVTQRRRYTAFIPARCLKPDPPGTLRVQPVDQPGVIGRRIGHSQCQARGVAGNVEPRLADIDPGYDHAIINHLRRSILVQEPMAPATMRIR